METTNKRKILTTAEKIEKLEKAIARYEQLLAASKEKLYRLKHKEQKSAIEDIIKDLINSGKSIEEIKSMLQ